MPDIFICQIRADTLGMVPCKRCGQLSYTRHDNFCDRTPEEIEEDEEEARNTNRPDADYWQVEAMLNLPESIVDFIDPSVIEKLPLEFCQEGKRPSVVYSEEYKDATHLMLTHAMLSGNVEAVHRIENLSGWDD
jgi:hypothetical protein